MSLLRLVSCVKEEKLIFNGMEQVRGLNTEVPDLILFGFYFLFSFIFFDSSFLTFLLDG